jgi:VWFA-related protein
MHERTSKWVIGASFLAALAIPMALASQGNKTEQQPQTKPSPPFKLTATANVVLVPVVVTDKRGQHVPGLAAADFEVKEEGVLQAINGFEEISAETAKVQPPPLPPNTFTNEVYAEHPKKLEIIAIDQVNVGFVHGIEGSRGLISFLAKNISADTLLAMVALRPNGVQFVHNFTSDPAVLVSAVKKLEPSTLTAGDTRTQDVLGDTLEVDAETARLAALFSGADFSSLQGGSAAAGIAMLRAQAAAQRARLDSSRESQQALVTLECLEQIAKYFSAVPGRKSLIWVTTGFRFSQGAITGELTRGTTPEDWQRAMRALEDANIAVYAIDVSGLIASGGPPPNLASLTSGIKAGGAEGGVGARSASLESVSSGNLIDPNESRHMSMRSVADQTGGEAYYNSNNIGDLFRRAGDESGQYYILAYNATNAQKPGWRKLSVKVHRDGVKVRARSGYWFTTSAKDTDAARQAEALMAAYSEVNFTALPFKGQWQQIEPAGNDRKVHFTLLIPPGVATVDAEHENHISIDFRIFAQNASGQQVGNIGQRLDRKLALDEISQIQTQGVSYLNALTLPPGQYVVHFVVRDNVKGALGSVVAPLKVD